MIHTILFDSQYLKSETIDQQVNEWIENNPEYNIMSVNVTYCGGTLLAVINYEEMIDELDCPYIDTEVCDGECSDCEMSEELLSGDN